MNLFRHAVILIFIFVAASALAQSAAPQTTASPEHKSTKLVDDRKADAEMANRVRQEFLHAWNGYKKYAWGHDELKPLSNGYRDWHSGTLLMTPVDALDTMILMGRNDVRLKEEAGKTLEYIAKNLNFDQDIEVKNFEITI